MLNGNYNFLKVMQGYLSQIVSKSLFWLKNLYSITWKFLISCTLKRFLYFSIHLILIENRPFVMKA